MMSTGTLGFVGLGNMGVPMVSRLLTAGFGVTGYDVSNRAGEELNALRGYSRAESIDAVADHPIVFLMLPSSRVVEEVLERQGLLSAMSAGSLIVDMGSSQPRETQRMAGRARSHELRLMDAPVSGGVPAARDGSLTIMAGGPHEWLDECRPALEHIGNHIVHAGPVGTGHALKALNNLLSASHLIASSEALIIGTHFGLDPQVMMDAINESSGRSGSTLTKWPRYILPRTFNSGFQLQLLLKDTRIAVELAHETGVAAPHAESTLSLWQTAGDELPKDADHTDIHRWLEGKSERPGN